MLDSMAFLVECRSLPSEHVQQYGLLFAATVDIGEAAEVEPKLRAIKEVGAVCVNVQMLDHDTPTDEAVTRARQVMEAAGRLEMDVAIEVHRDTCTETPEKAYALAEGFEQAEGRPLKMTWDFSHPAIIKHLSPPYWIDWRNGLILSNSPNSFTSVLLTDTHCQIPALGHDGEFTPEFLDWLEFADRLIEVWLQAATPGREMFVCPEQGAMGYTLSVFPDRWKDVQAIRGEVERVWQKHIKNWTPPQ